MDYDNKFDKTDEMNTDSPEEFATDFVVETERRNATEIGSVPDEYALDHDANDGTPSDFSNALKDENGYKSETATDYGDYETLGKNGEKTESNVETPENDADTDYSYEFDPSDETAATIDECYNNDCSAREKCKLDDYEIISDVLGGEKQIVKLYSTALCETAEEPLRNIIRDNFVEAANDQYEVFDFMQKRGMYPVEQADENKIDEAKRQFAPLCENCK